MPHKRAKRSVREKLRSRQGADMAPGKQLLSQEAIPKSFARVINASKIREEWMAKKRKPEEPAQASHVHKRRKLTADEDKRAHNFDNKTGGKLTTSHLKIKPGESMQHFNRRVEDDMRPLVKAATRSSNTVARSTLKAEAAEARAEKQRPKNRSPKATLGDDEKARPRSTRKPVLQTPPPAADQHIRPQKDFVEHSSSAPRRLNDIAQAPPEFKKLPRGAAALCGGTGSGNREGVLSMAQKSMMEQEREKVIMRYRELKARRRWDGGREPTDQVGSEEV